MKKMKLLAGLFLGLLTSASSLMADQYINYDYIIVGNGTAGAVLARKLSDNHKKKVLVLEAGVNLSNDPEVLNASGPTLLPGFTDLTNNPKYAETYTITVGTLQSVAYSEGRGWGGSSLHNYLEAIRGTPSIYDQWATISNNPMWSYNNLLPMMRALENYTPCMSMADLTQRGVGGPISITQNLPITSDPLGTLLAGPSAGNAGFITDLNNPNEMSTTGYYNIGFSPFQTFATPGSSPCTVGQRSFSANAFLPPSVVSPDGKAEDGRLLRIESNAHVSRVIIKNKKAIGVEFVYGNKGNKVTKAYGKKIILCAGAINSPAILQRSGIGDPAVLTPLGIDVVVNNPNVGTNLINQYGVQAVVLGTTNAVPILQGTLNASGNTGLLPLANYAYPQDSTRRVQLIGVQGGPGVALIIGFILEPKSRGSIKIVSRDPFVQPNIDLGMYSDFTGPAPYAVNGTDANLAVVTYQLIGQSVGAANMLFPSGSELGNPAALFTSATNASGRVIADHIVGTTRMGTSIQNGVVDGTLHVFGIKNLMVADVGVAPLPPDGNICFGAYMIGLGAAQILGASTPPAL
ncbi:MAG: GMC family oxidoreductase [Verrucomicrobia bacterium]|nr:GMC family oxidoreductase [Verrucomicrobiota bacterium]